MNSPSWFQEVSPGDRSMHQHLMSGANQWGRTKFASSFAQGGYAAAVFADTSQGRMDAYMGRNQSISGSKEHIQRMRQLAANTSDPAAKAKINKQISGLAKNGGVGSMGKAIGGALLYGGMTAGLVVAPFVATEGSITDRSKAAVSGAAFEVGSGVGGLAGKRAAANVIGKSFLGRTVASGAVRLGARMAGGFAMTAVAEAGMAGVDHMRDLGSKTRMNGLEWGQQNGAFDTQRAHTMRQQSLQQMNNGTMSARSLLGREAVYLHQ